METAISAATYILLSQSQLDFKIYNLHGMGISRKVLESDVEDHKFWTDSGSRLLVNSRLKPYFAFNCTLFYLLGLFISGLLFFYY